MTIVVKVLVFHDELTKLAAYNSGFYINTKKKRLGTVIKSGCCWHRISEYEVIDNEPRLVYRLTEDAYTKKDIVMLTEEKAHWTTTIKEVPEKEYYKK